MKLRGLVGPTRRAPACNSLAVHSETRPRRLKKAHEAPIGPQEPRLAPGPEGGEGRGGEGG
eukprot:5020400-Pyramimonas_sp.AAC.1